MYLSDQPPAASAKRRGQQIVAVSPAVDASPVRQASLRSVAAESSRGFVAASDASSSPDGTPPAVPAPLLAAEQDEPRFITDWSR
jgi:hypothetical protein